MSELSEYWNSFYQSTDRVLQLVPSQFAAFVTSEALDGGVETVVDMGCGSGRDAFFFAKYFPVVVGVDASSEAIAGCTRRGAEIGAKERLQFICDDIGSNNLKQSLIGICGGKRTLVYARFFLHAIDDVKQCAFLHLARSLLAEGGILAVEFRTGRDAFLRKETPGHYRRYIDTEELMHTLTDSGFAIKYQVEGSGYAKYRSDDAHVARLMCVI